MTDSQRMSFLREIAGFCREIEEVLAEDDFLDGIRFPSDEQISRQTLLYDAVRRLRRQAGHMTAALVLGPVEGFGSGPRP